ncbi:MAG: hypothetical protein ACR2P2_03915 [Nakamurella sp.]
MGALCAAVRCAPRASHIDRPHGASAPAQSGEGHNPDGSTDGELSEADIYPSADRVAAFTFMSRQQHIAQADEQRFAEPVDRAGGWPQSGKLEKVAETPSTAQTVSLRAVAAKMLVHRPSKSALSERHLVQSGCRTETTCCASMFAFPAQRR